MPGELYTIEANDKIPDNCKYPLALIQDARDQKQTNTDLAKLLKLKIGAKVIKFNIENLIQDRLINSQKGIIRHTGFAQYSSCKVSVKFPDDQAGSKAMRSTYLGRQNSLVPIEKCETEISINNRSASPSIKRPQILLTLAWASTARKGQGLSLEQAVIDFDL